MPRTTSKPTNSEALEQLDVAVERVASLIRSVLVKYPRETLAPTLVPFTQRPTNRLVRRSFKGDELVVVTSTFFSRGTTQVRMPVTLLDAPEQVITRWARDQYWSAIKEEKLRALRDARDNATRAHKAVVAARRELERLEEVQTQARKLAEAAESRTSARKPRQQEVGSSS